MKGLTRMRKVIFGIALLAYLPGFWWGTPHATAPDRRQGWGVDDEPPLGPLAQLKDMITPGPSANPNLGYPMLHPFMVLGVFSPYLAYLKTTGKLAAPSATYPYGLADPVRALHVLGLIAHLLSVVLAAGIVLAAFEIGRLLWGSSEGQWAAAFALLSYPMFYYSRTSNVDVPVLFFTAWGLVAFARCLKLGVTVRRIALLGALGGLAIATKEPAFASFIGVPFALLFAPMDSRIEGPRSAVLTKAALAGVTCAVATYLVGSGAVIDPERWISHLDFVRHRVGEVTEGDLSFVTFYARTPDGDRKLAGRLLLNLAATMTLPGLLLALGGLAISFRRTPRATWFAVTTVSYVLVLFFSARAAQLRYLMPAAFPLAVFAGFAAASAVRVKRGVLSLATIAVSAAAIVLATLRAIDLTYAMLRDSRYAAGTWLSSVSKPGDLLEFFGPIQKNPSLPRYIVSKRETDAEGEGTASHTDDQTFERIRLGWAARRPRFILLMPDYTSKPGEPYSATCPPRVFADLQNGALGYVLTRQFETPALFPWARRPALDYPVVNPPIRIYMQRGDQTVPASQTQ